MATSSLHPHSSNPFRDPNRSPSTLTPQATGSTAVSTNPFLSPSERLSPQATGTSQYYTPPPSGGVTPAPSTSSMSTPLQTQGTGSHTSAFHIEPLTVSTPPTGPPPSKNTASSPPQTTYAPPSGPPPQQSYAPPPGPPPQSTPRPPSPTRIDSMTEAPPPYTPAADVRQGEVPLETGPRRAYAPEWHPDGQTWRNQSVMSNVPGPSRQEPDSSWMNERPSPASPGRSSRPTVVVSQDTGSSSWSAYPGRQPPPSHPSTLGRANTTAGTVSRAPPGPPTTVPTPGRALLHQGKVLAYPAQYECNKCHLTGYQAYDPSNPCRECWSLFAQPYEGIITFAPWDSPESVMTDEQNLQRPLPGSASRAPQPRPQSRPQQPPSAPPPQRPLSHPEYSSYSGLGQAPGSLPPAGWSATNLRPSHSISYAGRPPPGSLVVRPGDPRIGGRVCWKCSGDGWTYKSMGLETKTCRACGGLGRLF